MGVIFRLTVTSSCTFEKKSRGNACGEVRGCPEFFLEFFLNFLPKNTVSKTTWYLNR